MQNVPSDQLTALHNAAVYFGRNAKREIRHAWTYGDWRAFPSFVDTAALQRFRNASGPSALARLSLRKLGQNAGL